MNIPADRSDESGGNHDGEVVPSRPIRGQGNFDTIVED
jgi:hypothetical protein